MKMVEDMADELAQRTLRLAEATGDEGLVDRVGALLGASSSTLEEAFLTAARVRRAQARAEDMLSAIEAKLAPKPAAAPAPKPAAAQPAAAQARPAQQAQPKPAQPQAAARPKPAPGS